MLKPGVGVTRLAWRSTSACKLQFGRTMCLQETADLHSKGFTLGLKEAVVQTSYSHSLNLSDPEAPRFLTLGV